MSVMADYSRPSPSTPDFRRPRSHIPCPRCRIDPSHVYRPYWESNSPAVVSVAESSELRTNGYPDLCPPSRGNRQQQQSIVPSPPTQQQQQPRTNPPNQRYIHTHSRSADSTFSARPGDTWRIRGVLENHQQPDVTRRIDSHPGPLPDVTRHSASANSASSSHSRIPSSYEAASQSTSTSTNSRVAPQTSGRFQAVFANNPPTVYRDIQVGSQHSAVSTERNSNERGSSLSWKREHQCSNPWVSRTQQNSERQPSQEASSLPCVSGQQPTSSAGSSHIDNWRPPPPPPQHVLSQCPLPDLVTPRRQARKQCCGLLAAHSVAVRWLVIAVAALGLLCSVVGTVVGVVRATGRDHLTVSLLLIGLGIVLVSMSGFAWRLTARDAPSCRAMFGLRRARHEPHRRFVPRVPHYGRPHPFSAMLYPDIPLRPPPPSYQASMQEYRLRLLLMDRQQQVAPPTTHPPPPPSYRGPPTVYPRFPINIGSSDYSRPPSYRSRPSSAGQPSPVGPEDLTSDIPSASDPPPPDVSMLTVMSTSSHNSSQLLRPPPSTVNNHIEVVAQV